MQKAKETAPLSSPITGGVIGAIVLGVVVVALAAIGAVSFFKLKGLQRSKRQPFSHTVGQDILGNEQNDIPLDSISQIQRGKSSDVVLGGRLAGGQ